MALEGKGKLVAAIGAVAAAAVVTVWPQLEGRRYTPYYDQVGVLTVCAGITNPKPILNHVYSKEECDALESYSEAKHAQGFMDCVTKPITNGQRVAGTLLAGNVGVGGVCKSTFVRELNRGNDKAACEAILMWRFLTIKGQKVDCSFSNSGCAGIWKRRLLEKSYCEGNL